jgi:hypothetical protein
MAKDQSKRLKPAQLASDRASVAALKTITNYSPANPDFSQTALDTSLTELDAAQQAETQATVALAAARDNAVAKEWELHNKVMGMKDQVIALFGRDSNQAQTVGRKKPSERKSPRRETTQA